MSEESNTVGNTETILKSVQQGEEFLDKFIITDEVLNHYIEDEEVRQIKAPHEYQDAIRRSFLGEEAKGDRLPWRKATDFRFRENEVTIWTGFNGHKKSMVLGQVCLGLLAQTKKMCIASPEMHPVQTLKRMIRQYAGDSDVPQPIQERFFAGVKNKLWIYDQSKSIKPKNLLAIIKYTIAELGVEHFVIDSLMKCGINEDDLNRQKWFVDELTTIAKDHPVHIHLVAHQRKPMANENKVGGKYGVAGSANITNLAHNVISVYQNEKEDRHYDNALVVQKQRNYDGDADAQPKYSFWFDNKSLQFLERNNEPAWTPPDWSVWGHQIK